MTDYRVYYTILDVIMNWMLNNQLPASMKATDQKLVSDWILLYKEYSHYSA